MGRGAQVLKGKDLEKCVFKKGIKPLFNIIHLLFQKSVPLQRPKSIILSPP